ncbi:MAG: hypothetical protein RL090_160 [Bacteroidota bacterium]|jgi:tetratricopeptide (TPR) repeat protein
MNPSKMKLHSSIRCLFAILAVLASTVFSFAQTNKKGTIPKLTKEQAAETKKVAAEMYKVPNWVGAREQYKLLVNYDPEDVEFLYRYGLCIVNSNSDKNEAIAVLTKAADKKDAPKDVYFQLGRALLGAGLYDEAIDAFDKFKELNKGQINPKLNFEMFQEYCYNAKEFVKKPLEVKFTNPGKSVNSPGMDYACVSMAVDTVVFFTSGRKGNMGGMTDDFGEVLPDVYFSSKTDSGWTKAKNAGISINSEFYDISTGMNTNGDKLFVYKEDGIALGDIYVSEQQGKTWMKATLLDESMATKTLEFGACMTNDGKRVFFAAEGLKGGLGGKDIYMMEKDEAGKWGAPVNLGSTVNTKYNEDNPVIWHDGKTLFFASQGHTSMGGYDIFMTSRSSSASAWEKPYNIGYPLNNALDNQYFTLAANGRTGYVADFKQGGMGDLDIWYFSLNEPLVKNGGTLFRATIVNAMGLPAKDAMCSVVKESTGEIIAIMEPAGPASQVFVLLSPGTYKLKARSAKMGRLEEEIIVVGDEGEKGIRRELKLQQNPSDKVK